MKKIILTILFCLLLFGTVRADLSDGFFCLVKKDGVVISLKKADGYYYCKSTIQSLEQLIVETAKDLMNIQSYINKRQDVEYWTAVKKEKIAILDNLQLVRKNIITNMKTFESNLIKKSVQLFVLKIAPYKLTLQKSLAKITALGGAQTSQFQMYAFLLSGQISTIDSLSTASTQDQLITLLSRYIYLKKEIAGKSE